MEYPSNSKMNKPAPAEAPKPAAPVITGKVIERKPSAVKRLRETFIRGDATSVMGYIVYDILVPVIQDTFVDVVTMGIERAIFGDTRGGSPSRRARGASSSNGATGYVNYGNFSKPGDRYGSQQQGRQLSQNARATLNFNEIILETRPEAESVIEHLAILIDQYQVAKVADLYDILKVTNSDFTAHKWGWDSMVGASVDRVRGGGYLLNLPRAIELPN